MAEYVDTINTPKSHLERARERLEETDVCRERLIADVLAAYAASQKADAAWKEDPTKANAQEVKKARARLGETLKQTLGVNLDGWLLIYEIGSWEILSGGRRNVHRSENDHQAA